MYMGNTTEVIKILESEGITTKEQAMNRLRGDAQGNVMGHAMCVGSGKFGSSLAGTAKCVQQVADHFEKKNQTVVKTGIPDHIRTPPAYRYSCINCDYVRDGLLDHPNYSWSCPICKDHSFPKVEKVLFL
jgi:lipopolysaccharide biosynthesis regulator YciM